MYPNTRMPICSISNGKGVYVFMVVQKQTKGWIKKSSSFPHTSGERIFFQSFARAKNNTKNAIETEQDIRRALNAKKMSALKTKEATFL